MFGRVTATPLVRLDANKDLEMAVAELLATTEYPQIARWIQFPTGAALFLMVPNDPESGAIYVYDRRDGAWYWVGFEDQKYSGYNLTDLDVLLEQCQFLQLVENPCLLGDKDWFVTPGHAPSRQQAGANCRYATTEALYLLRTAYKSLPSISLAAISSAHQISLA